MIRVTMHFPGAGEMRLGDKTLINLWHADECGRVSGRPERRAAPMAMKSRTEKR